MKLFIFLSLVFSINSFATTAVLCGDPEVVDANEKKATIHMIFEHPDYEVIEDLRVYFRGVSISVEPEVKSGEVYEIRTKFPNTLIEVNREDISYCESETLFTIKRDGKTVESCRCFEG